MFAELCDVQLQPGPQSGREAEGHQQVSAEVDEPAEQAKWLRRASDTALWVDSLHYQVNIPLATDRPRTEPYSQYNETSRETGTKDSLRSG